MAIQYSFKNLHSFGCDNQNTCPDKFGCPPDRVPDFVIRRHDTKPPFKVQLEDCDGPLNVQGLVVEVNMWATGKLKKAISADCEYFGLTNDVGFEQIMVGDIIAIERVRSPEYMLVVGFDECNKLVRVQRGYHGSTADHWKKGSNLRIFRILNGSAQTELVYEDVQDIDGTINEDTLTSAVLAYEWSPEDVCLPGCYWFEFKILKMKNVVLYLPGGNWVGETHQVDETFYTGSIHTDSSVRLSFDSINDRYYIGSDLWDGIIHVKDEQYYTGSEHNDGSVFLDTTDTPVDDSIIITSDTSVITGPSLITSETSEIPNITPICNEPPASCIMSFTDVNLNIHDFGCGLDENVEWVRRFPTTGEGFLIKIENSFNVLN